MSKYAGVPPKVSVVASVHNGETYLQESVESILDQTFSDFEFIIVDDGSTDGTADILKSFSDPRIVRLHHPTNQGFCASLNDGLKAARGELIARHDADDISLPNRLEEQVCLLNRFPHFVIVGSNLNLINEDGTHIGFWRYPSNDTELRWGLLFFSGFAHNSVMFRADTIRRNRLRYDEHFETAEDYEFWSRLLCYGQGYNMQQPLVKYRRHSHQVSRISRAQQKSLAERISESNLKRLGVCITSDELKTIRDWYSKKSTPLRKQDVASCRKLWQILDAFGKQPGVESTLVDTIRGRWVDQFLGMISVKGLCNFWAVRFFCTLVFSNGSLVVAHMSKRLVRKIWTRRQVSP